MPARSIVNQGLYLQLETTPGTAATTAMKRVLGLKATPGYTVESEGFMASGYKVETSRVQNTEMGSWSTEAIQDYNAALWLLLGMYGKPTSGLVAGGTLANEHLYNLNTKTPDTRATFTAMWGDTTKALQSTYAMFQSLGLTINRGSVSISSSIVSREPVAGIALPAGTNEVQQVAITGSPTGGTFTLSFGGQTTGNLSYAALTSIATGLQALSTIGPGNVSVAGGPLPGTPVAVTFTGALAGQDVAALTGNGALLTGGTTPAVVITTTTPGVPPFVEVPSIPIAARTWDVYSDNTWAALGTTKLLAAYEGTVTAGDKYTPDWVINSALPSFSEMLEAESTDYTANFTLGFDATAEAVISDYKAGTLKFLRFQSKGPIIEAATQHEITIDLCIRITSPGEIGTAPNSPSVILPFNGQLTVDPVSGFASKARVVNKVVSL